MTVAAFGAVPGTPSSTLVIEPPVKTTEVSATRKLSAYSGGMR